MFANEGFHPGETLGKQRKLQQVELICEKINKIHPTTHFKH